MPDITPLQQLLGGLGTAGVGLFGYDKIRDLTQRTRDNLFDTDGTFDTVRKDINAKGAFQPFSVKSAVGTGGMGTDGRMNYNLSAAQQAQMDALGSQSGQMYNNAMQMDPRMAQMYNQQNAASNQFMQRSLQDTAGREADIYGRIRAMQRPEEQRQQESMEAGLFGSGRGGMASDAYGGTPEEMAYNKARAEAMNTASYQAMGQAQNEMMNQGSLAGQYGGMAQGAFGQGLQGQQMMGQLGALMQQGQYMPMNQLQAQMAQGLQGSQLQNQSSQNLAGMLAQLGLGQATTDVNLANVDAGMLSSLFEALGAAAGGAGQGLGGLLPS
jgi:hypothetical protein